MAKRPVPKYDFKAFGAAIKAARTGRKESRKKVSDEMFISPRYLANIENKGQHPSLQIFFELMLRYNISVDQFLLETPPEKNTQRRQLDALLDGMSDTGMVDIGCVRLYECDSKPYLHLPSWEVHQQVRAKRGKYPSPEDACNHMISNAPGIQFNPNPSNQRNFTPVKNGDRSWFPKNWGIPSKFRRLLPRTGEQKCILKSIDKQVII